jgi:hypothetical protein
MLGLSAGILPISLYLRSHFIFLLFYRVRREEKNNKADKSYATLWTFYENGHRCMPMRKELDDLPLFKPKTERRMRTPIMMSLLKAAGESLYGERWQRNICKDLGIAERTLQNWKSGRNFGRPRKVLPKLIEILKERQKSIDDLIKEIEKEI